MSLVSGMLAVQIMGSCLTMSVRGISVHTMSSSSCVTVSHIYHDERRGKAKDVYCKYKGKILHPGESYEKSKFETCTCSEDGLECCKSKESSSHDHHDSHGPHEFHHGPHDLHHDTHDMSHGPHGFHNGPHDLHHDPHDISHGPHDIHHDLHDDHGFGHDDHMSHDGVGRNGGKHKSSSSFHSSEDLHPFDHPHFK